MAGKAIKVQGVQELLKKLGEFRQFDTIQRISFRATFGASKELRNIARDFAPSQSGELRRGFAMKRMTQGTKRGYTVGVRAGRTRNKATGDDPFYWWFLEFGTVHIAPLGFFRRAFDLIRGTATTQIIAAGRKAVLDSGNRALMKYGNGKK